MAEGMWNRYGRCLNELERALDSFDAVFQEVRPDLYPRLRPGLSAEQIRLLEARLAPYWLPKDLVVLYAWHDGWDASAGGEYVNLLPSGRFNPLSEAVEQYAQWCSMNEQQEDTWNPLWFPAFGDSNGEFVELHDEPEEPAGVLWSGGALWSFDSHDAVVWTSYDSVASLFRASTTLWMEGLMPFEGVYPDGVIGWVASYNRRTQRPDVVARGARAPVTGHQYREISRFPSLGEWPTTWLVAAGLVEPSPTEDGDAITVARLLREPSCRLPVRGAFRFTGTSGNVGFGTLTDKTDRLGEGEDRSENGELQAALAAVPRGDDPCSNQRGRHSAGRATRSRG
jgi:cell wall assembly regulator SMI1